MKSESFISVIISEPEISNSMYEKVNSIYQELEFYYSDYEIIIVTQSFNFMSAQSDLINKILSEIPSVRQLHVSGHIDSSVAFAAGAEHATGDFIITFDLYRDSPKEISKIVNLCKKGNDIVIGVAKQTSSIFYPVFRFFANKILAKIGYDLPKDATYMRCLSRRVVNAVTRSGRHHHQFFIRIQKSGYEYVPYRYVVDDENQIRKSTRIALRNFLNLIVFNSTKPLRWMSFCGVLGSTLAFIYGVFSLLSNVFRGDVADGWTTLVLFISSLFIILFMILAFLGEYLARLLDDGNDQEEYSLVYEKNSFVMVNRDRLNVYNEPEILDLNRVQTGRDR